MHKRDIGILLLACIAMVVSLQREGISSFRKAWLFDQGSTGDDAPVQHHILPPPVVADLNGDGHLEVVAASPALKVQVLAPVSPSRVATGFAPARVIAEVSLLDRTVGSAATRRPVALAVGHIDKLPHAPGVRPLRKQVVVVVTAGLQVLCYDHNLKLMWEKSLGHMEHMRHARIKEVSVLVTPHQVAATDRGLIVVGASIQRGDLASGEAVEGGQGEAGAGGAASDDEDILSMAEKEMKDKAAHARSAGDSQQLEDIDMEGKADEGAADTASAVVGMDTARHFSYHGLEGGTGAEKWHHEATDFHKDLAELASSLRPQNDYRLEAEKLEGRHFGEVSCREYRESILHQALPHAWTDAADTHMVEAHFVKHKVAKGAAKDQLASKGTQGRLQHATASRGHHPPGPSKHSNLLNSWHSKHPARAGPVHAGHTQHAAHHHHHHNVTANALVVHLEEGIEVIHLFTGRPICQLHLAPQELHADINGDGVMDHVQVYRGSDVSESGGDSTALASEAGGRQHHAASHCAALATSGIPPQHHLWQANVCHSSRFLSQIGEGRSALLHGEEDEDDADGMEILPPVFVPLPRLGKGYGSAAHHHGLVVVMNSKGELHALGSKGTPIWQTYFPVEWRPQHLTEQDAEEAAAAAPSRPTLMAMSLHTHGVPSTILAAGDDGAVVVSEHGRELASLTFPAAPTQKLVVADFNGDGLNDIIAVTQEGILGYAQVQHVGGNTLSTLLLVAVVVMGIMLWNSHQASQLGAGSARKLRSTEYTD